MKRLKFFLFVFVSVFMCFQADLFANESISNTDLESIQNCLEALDVSDKDVASFEYYSDIEEDFYEDISVYISDDELEKVLQTSLASNQSNSRVQN